VCAPSADPAPSPASDGSGASPVALHSAARRGQSGAGGRALPDSLGGSGRAQAPCSPRSGLGAARPTCGGAPGCAVLSPLELADGSNRGPQAEARRGGERGGRRGFSDGVHGDQVGGGEARGVHRVRRQPQAQLARRRGRRHGLAQLHREQRGACVSTAMVRSSAQRKHEAAAQAAASWL